MAESIESFVARLQADGVEAGRKQAREIVQQAEDQAKQVIDSARRQAEQIVAEARREHESMLKRAETELQVAARDAVLALGQTLNKVLNVVLARGVGDVLGDPQVLRQVLHDVVLQYAKADAAGERIDIRVNHEMLGKLCEWALGEMRGGEKGRLSIELADGLRGGGFEYSVKDSTVEVTVNSVVELLTGMVTPKLAELVGRAMNDQHENNG